MSVDVMKNYSPKENKSSLRKSNKPIMEKRRRARINNCLSQLKTLVLESMKKDSSQYSKLEKADILEMTVKYLRTIQRQQLTSAIASDPNVVSKYRAGYQECATEVTRYLNNTQTVEPEVKSRLAGHLTDCLHAQTPCTGQSCNGQYRVSPIQHPQPVDVAKPLSVHIPQNSSKFPSVPGSNSLLVARSPQNQKNSTAHAQTCQPIMASSPVHSLQQSTNVSGQYQILPAGNLYNGPIAIYMGNVNQSNSPQLSSIPVFTLHVPKGSDVSPSAETGTNSNHVYAMNEKYSEHMSAGNPHNVQDYCDKLWRPW